MNKIIHLIKEKKWGNSLTRTGFLQPKIIAVEAIMLPVELTKGIIAKMDGYIWVNDFVTYSQNSLDSFPALFKKAFEVNYKWPLSIINSLDELAKKENLLMKKIKLKVKNISQASDLFKTCVNLLHEIMKYYVIAVPLTDYCENELIKRLCCTNPRSGFVI